MPSKQIQKGWYRHYKGGLAHVIDQAKHTETGEIFVAYYHEEQESGMMVLWIRPKTMFEENIIHEGKKIPRFTYLKKGNKKNL